MLSKGTSIFKTLDIRHLIHSQMCQNHHFEILLSKYYSREVWKIPLTMWSIVENDLNIWVELTITEIWKILLQWVYYCRKVSNHWIFKRDFVVGYLPIAHRVVETTTHHQLALCVGKFQFTHKTVNFILIFVTPVE